VTATAIPSVALGTSGIQVSRLALGRSYQPPSGLTSSATIPAREVAAHTTASSYHSWT